MCLAVPAKVIEKKDMVATVEVEGIRRDISLMLLPEANEGDYILMHAGFAIQVIDEEEAKITTELLKEVLGTNEPASERNETDSNIIA
ncbi:HypC/HybG/HupF family hydrogenase formation chaperone [Megamonas funiformis]|uniref:HypC/HybG/HupF family hydrogenase formation chaperone n=1 Tax=Megamonas funiformis TaxID=437897 RepID=UPI003F956A31